MKFYRIDKRTQRPQAVLPQEVTPRFYPVQEPKYLLKLFEEKKILQNKWAWYGYEDALEDRHMLKRYLIQKPRPTRSWE